MARDEIFTARDEKCKTEDEKFMRATKIVHMQALNTEDNSLLTFFLELEKSITKEASGQKQKQTSANQENKTVQKKLKRENSKCPIQKKK